MVTVSIAVTVAHLLHPDLTSDQNDPRSGPLASEHLLHPLAKQLDLPAGAGERGKG